MDGFDVDLGATGEVLDRVERGEADWGIAVAPQFFEPGRRLAAKYGVNRSRFFVKPGHTLQLLAFNSSRGLFANNPRLRRAVNFALNRRALARLGGNSLDRRLTDQYLPFTLPGFRDADVYPLERADLSRAKALARGNTRGGKATFYVVDIPPRLALAQLVKQQLAAIGIEVELVAIPAGASFIARLRTEGAPWDLTAFILERAPGYSDPYSFVNELFDGRFAGESNISRFDSQMYNRLMRQASRLRGEERYRAYGELDVRLARDAAPLAALSYFNELTLVSKRVGCVVLNPSLDLTAVCLK